MTKNLLKTEADYYSITINGMKVGAANTEEEVIIALASARQELSAQYSDVVYMDPDIEINKESRTVAQRMSVNQLSGAIYSYMFDNVMDVDFHMYYTVRLGDFVVTLESKEDVIKLFEKLIQKYDPNNAFTVSLDTLDAATGTYTVSVNEKLKKVQQQRLFHQLSVVQRYHRMGRLLLTETGLQVLVSVMMWLLLKYRQIML